MSTQAIHKLIHSIHKEYTHIIVCDISHINTIIRHHISINHVITTEEYYILKQLLYQLYFIWKECEVYSTINLDDPNIPNEHKKEIYNSLLDKWNQLSACKQQIVDKIDAVHFFPSQLKQPPENIKEGAEWYNQLCTLYTKIGGIFPTTPYDCIKMFERHWNILSDIDTHTMYHILVHILGGNSIEYNAYCLENWIMQNKDILRTFSNWKITSCKSGN